MTTPPTTPSSLIEHAAFVRALARHLVADAHGAEDVGQDTWVAALERPPRHGAHPRAWLATLVERLAWRRGRGADRLRRRERAAARGERLEGVDETLARSELLRRVTDAVLALEEPYRATVLERFYENRDARAIAERSGVPLATVRSRLQRALTQLRERLDRECGERGAWCTGLLTLIGEPGPAVGPIGSGASGGAPPAGAALSAGTGGLAMGTVSKAGMGLAAAALAVLLWRATQGERGERPDARVEAPRAALLEEPPADAPTDLAPGRAPESAQRSTLPGSAALESALGALEGRVTWQRTGGPVAGEELRFLAWNEPVGTRLKRALTDQDGRYRVEGLAPGKVDVWTAHGAGNRVEITAGETATLDLWTPAGSGIRGRVVDPDGVPVPGARLWISFDDPTDGLVVARTGAGGAFAIADVREALYLAAIADGFASSGLCDLGVLRQAAPAQDDLDVTLTLTGTGGRLALEIVGPDGLPVAGALVRARSTRPPAIAPGRAGRVGIPPFDAWSDDAGRVWIDGLPPDSFALAVHARDMGIWKGTASIKAGETCSQRVNLEAEGVVAGTVRDSHGDPLSRVWIDYDDEEHDELRPLTTSDVEGHYELRSLAPGTVHLKAKRTGVGSASATLQVSSADAVIWDPVLSAGRVLSGRVVDEDGAPLAGWTVQVNAGIHSGWNEQATTDAEGSFRVVDLRTEPLTLALYRDIVEERVPTLRRPIADGETEVLLRVTRDQLCDASLTGRFLDPEGLPIARANVALWLPGASSAPGFRSDENGTFRIEHLCPGIYDVTVGFEDRAGLFLGRLAVGPREPRDLGTIALQDPAVLRITVAGESPEASETFGRFNLRQLDGEGHSGWAASLERAGAAAGIPLQPGSYALTASGGGNVATEFRRIELRSGETTTVDLVPRAGRYVSVLPEIPAGAALPRRIRCTARDGGGEVLLDVENEPVQGRFGWILKLAPELYAFQLVADDGRRASGTLTVTLDDLPETSFLEVRLPLR